MKQWITVYIAPTFWIVCVICLNNSISLSQTMKYENASEKTQPEPLANLNDIRTSAEVYVLWAQNDLPRFPPPGV